MGAQGFVFVPQTWFCTDLGLPEICSFVSVLEPASLHTTEEAERPMVGRREQETVDEQASIPPHREAREGWKGQPSGQSVPH